MIGFTKNLIRNVAQRLNAQAKSVYSNAASHQPAQGTAPVKVQPNKSQILQQARSERLKFMSNLSRSHLPPEPLVSRPSAGSSQSRLAPAGSRVQFEPSSRFAVNAQDKKLQELNQRLDKLNGRPSEDGKPIGLSQWQASLEQRLDKLNGHPTENGKPISLNERQASLEQRLDKLNARPTENGKPVGLNQWQASLEERLKALAPKATTSTQPSQRLTQARQSPNPSISFSLAAKSLGSLQVNAAKITMSPMELKLLVAQQKTTRLIDLTTTQLNQVNKQLAQQSVFQRSFKGNL